LTGAFFLRQLPRTLNLRLFFLLFPPLTLNSGLSFFFFYDGGDVVDNSLFDELGSIFFLPLLDA